MARGDRRSRADARVRGRGEAARRDVSAVESRDDHRNRHGRGRRTGRRRCACGACAGQSPADGRVGSQSLSADDRRSGRSIAWPTSRPADYSVAVMSATTTMPVATVDAYREAIMAGQATRPALMRDLQASGAPFPSMSGIRVGDQILQQGFDVWLAVRRLPAPSEDWKHARRIRRPTIRRRRLPAVDGDHARVG